MSSDIESKRTARRAAMPVVTSIVEHYEAQGVEPKVIFASENGITVGKRPDYREVFDIPQDIGRTPCPPRKKK